MRAGWSWLAILGDLVQFLFLDSQPRICFCATARLLPRTRGQTATSGQSDWPRARRTLNPQQPELLARGLQVLARDAGRSLRELYFFGSLPIS